MSFREEAASVIYPYLGMMFGKDSADLKESMSLPDDLGAKSVNYSQIANFLQDEYEVEVPFIALRKMETVGDVLDFLEEAMDY
jgi:acyl carrier protein